MVHSLHGKYFWYIYGYLGIPFRNIVTFLKLKGSGSLGPPKGECGLPDENGALVK